MANENLSEWFILVLFGLATFRISILISKELGPGFIFRKLRRMPPPKSSAREGLSCPFCVSMYVAAAFTLVLRWYGHTDWHHAPFWWLALSSFAIICNQQWTKGDLK